ncbi:MAG: hypothetical protein WCV59_01215 [Parcubacteria group bacterium]
MNLVEQLATLPEFGEIRNLAQMTVKMVFRTNVKNLFFEEADTPEINGFCNRIRALLKDARISEVPDNNNDLFNQIIRPLHIFQVERSL